MNAAMHIFKRALRAKLIESGDYFPKLKILNL